MEVIVYDDAEGKTRVTVQGDMSPEAAARAYLAARKVLADDVKKTLADSKEKEKTK